MAEGTGPLVGLKILDFMWWGAGAFGTKVLADMGAEVVKVESSVHLDWTRVAGPFIGGKVDMEHSSLFSAANTSKHSLQINVRDPRGLDIIKRCVPWADVVTENFSPGTMDRMGLGYDELRKLKSDIIMISSSSLGKKGVYKDRRGAAHLGAAMSGFWYLTGYVDREEPQSPNGIGWADLVQPMFTICAVLGGIDYRERTGKGQFVDISQIETMNHLMAPLDLEYTFNEVNPPKMGNRHPYASPHGVFRCQGQDQWCAIAVFSEEEWKTFCQAIGNPAWTKDPRFATREGRKRNEDELEKLVEAWTVNHSPREVMDVMQKAGVAAGVVQTVADIMDRDPQVKARDLFPMVEHPVAGAFPHPPAPPKFSKTPQQMRPAPVMGDYNEEFFGKVLRMSRQEVARLREEGVFK